MIAAIAIVAVFVGIFAALPRSEKQPEETGYVPTEADRILTEVLYSEALPVSSEAAGIADEFIPEAPLSGKLIFSGKNRDAAEYMKIFSLDVSSATATPEVFQQYLNFGAFGTEFKDVTDPQSDYFVSAVTIHPLRHEDSFGLHEVSAKDELVTYMRNASSTGERYFSWSSEANLLAFSRTSQSHGPMADNLQLQNWETVIFDPEARTVVKVIDDAVQAHWSPDGTSLIYLKADGLYTASLEGGVETLVIALEGDGQVLLNAMTALSPDGKYFAWTIPGHGIIVMYEIESWAPFTMKELGRIEQSNTQFYWPVFSPDGNYYSVQAIDVVTNGSGGRIDPRFEIRPTLGKNIVFTHPLKEYDFSNFFTDSWITDGE